jgi:hypothetical protein
MAFVTSTVDVTCCAQGLAALSPCDVLLDNQATASVFSNAELLTNIRKGKSRVRVTGMGGSVETDQVGDLQHFGTVHYLPESPANILCMADVEDAFNVTRVPSRSYTVHVSHRIWQLHVFPGRSGH